jgi:hypothetical protein
MIVIRQYRSRASQVSVARFAAVTMLDEGSVGGGV